VAGEGDLLAGVHATAVGLHAGGWVVRANRSALYHATCSVEVVLLIQLCSD